MYSRFSIKSSTSSIAQCLNWNKIFEQIITQLDFQIHDKVTGFASFERSSAGCALESVYREGWQSWAGSSVDRGNRGCVWSLGKTEEVKMAAWGALCLTYSETVATSFHNQNELPCFLAHFNRVLLFKRSLDLFIQLNLRLQLYSVGSLFRFYLVRDNGKSS